MKNINDGTEDASVLVVDDDPLMTGTVKRVLEMEDYHVECAHSVSSARDELKKNFYNIVLIDIVLPDGSGLEILREARNINEEMIVIMLTGYASLETAVSALNEGAFAYVQKPFNMDELKIHIGRAIGVHKLSMDNRNLLSALKDMSVKDPHTGLYNYRHLMERLEAEVQRARRYTLPLSVIMLDINFFKTVNDVYGHQYGDIILKEFARYIAGMVRASDIVTRYGGEEFVIVLPETGENDAATFGKRLLNSMAKHVFDPLGHALKLKVSAGLAAFTEGERERNTAEGLINSSDKALASAKETGGDELAVFSGPVKSAADAPGGTGRAYIDEILKKTLKMEKRSNQSVLETMYNFAKTIEARDSYSRDHAERTVSIVAGIAKRLGLPDDMTDDLKKAAVLHDLGKIAIPERILRKKSRLTDEEYKAVKHHPEIAADIVKNVYFLKHLTPFILYHHERFDGSGYPAGLKNNAIPLGARIIGAVDVYQALVSARPYRAAYSPREALKIMRKASGTEFDPKIVDALVGVLNGGA